MDVQSNHFMFELRFEMDVSKIVLGGGNLESINEVDFEKRLEYANVFRRRWIRLYVSIGSFLLYFIFYVEGEALLGWAHPLLAFFLCAYIIYSMGCYKCPRCNKVQMGRFVNVGSGIDFGKGIHPFPTECQSCGCILSRGRLLKEHNTKYDAH